MTQVRIGASIPVREDAWVTVQNPDGISNRNCDEPFDGSFHIQANGGRLTVVGYHGFRVLVRYKNELTTQGGTVAPSGTMFNIIAAGHLETYEVETNFAQQFEEVSLWKKAVIYWCAFWTMRKGVTAKVPKDQWMEVRNPEGIKNANCHHKFGETAFICEGGILRVEKRTLSSVLVSYQNPPNDEDEAAGTVAGDGALFSLSLWNFSLMSPVYEQIQSAREQEKERAHLLLAQEAATTSM